VKVVYVVAYLLGPIVKIPVDRDKVDIDLQDFTEIVAKALGYGGGESGK
jgi:hypothetical protein